MNSAHAVRAGGPRLSVRFVRTWNAYMPGDCATFPAAMARGLVARQIADPVNIVVEGEAPDGAELAMRGPGPRAAHGDQMIRRAKCAALCKS